MQGETEGEKHVHLIEDYRDVLDSEVSSHIDSFDFGFCVQFVYISSNVFAFISLVRPIFCHF